MNAPHEEDRHPLAKVVRGLAWCATCVFGSVCILIVGWLILKSFPDGAVVVRLADGDTTHRLQWEGHPHAIEFRVRGELRGRGVRLLCGGLEHRVEPDHTSETIDIATGRRDYYAEPVILRVVPDQGAAGELTVEYWIDTGIWD